MKKLLTCMFLMIAISTFALTPAEILANCMARCDAIRNGDIIMCNTVYPLPYWIVQNIICKNNALADYNTCQAACLEP